MPHDAESPPALEWRAECRRIKPYIAVPRRHAFAAVACMTKRAAGGRIAGGRLG
jgi:hypothetical protein